MQDYIVTRIPPQNFAVASANPCGREGGMTAPYLSSDNFVRLTLARTAAWNHWWRLYCEPDVWTDPAKRRAMRDARLTYQDAFFALALALFERKTA